MNRRSSASVRLVPAAVTVALGTLIAVQSRVNGELTTQTSTGLFPAWWTMVTGLGILAVIVAGHGPSRRGVAKVRAALSDGRLPWLTLTGGIFGALFLITQSVAVPLVGVAVFSVGIVAGQTTGSLVVDRLGISASGHRAITARRVGASVLAVVAVAVGVSDRLGGVEGVALYAALAFLAGVLIAPQQAVNGRVAVAAGSPFVAALGNFAGGVLVMSAALGVAVASSRVTVVDPTGAPWWAYLGGVLGLSVIAGAAWVVPTLGVLVFTLLSVLGQLAGSLVLDAVAPTPGASVGWHLLLAVGMTFAAIVIAAGPIRRG